MATIDLPVLPPRFYRYRPMSTELQFRQELSAIFDNYLWCSDYRSLNDPMEGYYGTSPWVSRQTNYQRLSKEISQGKRSVGICCFSDTYETELMWAHYAENYKGICVAYSTNDLLTALNNYVHIVRVAYNNLPPRINRNYSTCPQSAVRAILSHKKTPWLYEREWRLLVSKAGLMQSPPGPLKLSHKRTVKAVFLGSRIDGLIRENLVQKLSGSNIKVYEMKVSKYDHSWSLLKGNVN